MKRSLWFYFWLLVFIGALPSIIQTLWGQWRLANPEILFIRQAVLAIAALFGLAWLIRTLGLQDVIKGFFEAIFTVVGGFFRLLFFGLAGTDRWGGARYASPFENWTFFRGGSAGFLLDGFKRRLKPKLSFASILTAAQSGAGKTSSLVVPTIMTLDDCSMVITDIKGELYELTSGLLESKGYQIQVLNLIDLTRSHGFNPVLGADSFSEISKLANLLISASPSTGGKDDGYWSAGAEKVIRIILTCLRNQGDPEQRHLGEVKRLLSTFDHFTSKPGESKFGQWVLSNTLDDPSTWNEYKSFIAAPEKVCASFISTADVALLSIGNPELAALLQYDELDFAKLRTEKTALYLLCNQSDMSGTYSFVLSAFFTRLYGELLSELNPDHLPVYCLLDEVGNIRIPKLDVYLATARGYKVGTWAFLQSYSQLETRLGRSQADTIINAVGSHLYLPGMDLDTAERVSRRLGRKRPLPGQKPLPHAEAPLMTADQLITMRDEALLLTGNKRPFRFRIKPYYKQARFRRYARMKPAELPVLGQSVRPVSSEPEAEEPLTSTNPETEYTEEASNE